jgi:HK97 family phage major capsid protein
MTRAEREHKGVLDLIDEEGEKANAILAKAEEEDRDTSPEESEKVAEHMKAIKHLEGRKADLEDAIAQEKKAREYGIKHIEESDSKGIELGSNGFAGVQVKTAGEIFVESKGYQGWLETVRASGGVPRNFSTGQIELKGTLLEGAGSPGAGTGGGLIPVPGVVPGFTEKLFQRLTVNDLLPQAQTNGNTVRYVVEGTATSGAAGVAEAAAKPESTLALSTVDEPVKKIATALTVSDEMLEDAAQTQGYINGRLSLFVRIEEERQLVLGGGTNDLVGITGRSGVNTYPRGTVDNNAVALFKALNGTRGSSFLEPNAIVMNPANWQTTRLLTDTAGQFFGGGPFLGPYGGPQGPVGASGQVTGAMDNIWSKPVVVTTAIGAGTALLGAFDTAAQVFRRSGLTVEATNSHSDYFTKNLVAIRAEQRLALAVYRPAAFTLVTGLS